MYHQPGAVLYEVLQQICSSDVSVSYQELCTSSLLYVSSAIVLLLAFDLSLLSKQRFSCMQNLKAKVWYEAKFSDPFCTSVEPTKTVHVSIKGFHESYKSRLRYRTFDCRVLFFLA